MRPARILVVCTANIARSPLAEVLLQGHVHEHALHDAVLVASAGIRARNGYPAAESSASIAKQWGLDLTQHRSQAVSPGLAESADLVLTMSERQRDHLASRVTGLASRCFTLKELARLTQDLSLEDLPDPATLRIVEVARRAHRQRPVAAPADDGDSIPDPFGGPHEGYITMANSLVVLFEQVVPTLLGPAASRIEPEATH